MVPRAIAFAWLVTACGPGIETQDAGTGHASETDSTPGSRATASRGDDPVSDSTGVGGDERGDAAAKFDVAPVVPGWDPKGCERGPGALAFQNAIYPHGAFEPLSARFGYDWCGGNPVIQFFFDLDAEGHPSPQMLVAVRTDGAAPTIYDGTYAASFFVDGSWSDPDAEGTVEFLEPLDSWATNDPAAAVHLVARLDIHSPGWDLTGEIDVPFCDEAMQCSCPCE